MKPIPVSASFTDETTVSMNLERIKTGALGVGGDEFGNIGKMGWSLKK